ncbi:holo-ACP synthase [Oceanobacillus senegalensis]|uniref:holo-ACP synthase n=1 Tax=Oceanobacillus senegalensis TaxID=1936063 RepID=UPI000A30C467|nr:holo-ACP synthase [Oceanobacillus senegalensis]
MIKGIGIDIIELHRIQKSVKNHKFIERILTNEERQLYEQLTRERRRVEFAAGRFAAKEAFAKATGTGIGKLSFQDMKVLPNEFGAPVIHVKNFKKEKIFISITHSKEYAVAQVVIEE